MALTLNQIREQYPELTGTSDEVLVNFLHQNYYSDIPIDEFSKAVGFNSEGEAGWARSNVLIPALRDSFVATGGAVGYGLEASGIAPETGRYLQDDARETSERLTARQSEQAREDAGKTLIDENGNYGGYNGNTFVQQLFGSIPAMLAMAAPGGLLARGATAGAKALGAGKAATTIGSGLGFGAAEGIYSGATNAAQFQEEYRNTPFDKLVDNPVFIETYHTETDPEASQEQRLEQTRDILARRGGDDVFKKTTATTGGLGVVTGGGMFGMMRDGAKGGILSRVGQGFLKEGVLQEAPQSALEQRHSNVAKRDYLDPNQDVNQGVLSSGLEGGLVGGVMGVGGGVFSRDSSEAIADIGKSESVDEAIAAAGNAVSQPIGLPAPNLGIEFDRTAAMPRDTITFSDGSTIDANEYFQQRKAEHGDETRARQETYQALNGKPDKAPFGLPELVFTEDGKSLDKAELIRNFTANGATEQQALEYINSITERPSKEPATDALSDYHALQSGAVKSTQLQDQLKGILSRDRNTAANGSDAERIDAITSQSREPEPADSATQGASSNLAEGIVRANTIPGIGTQQAIDRQFQDGGYNPLSGAWETPNYAEQNIQPTAQPKRGNDRTPDTGNVGSISGNDNNLPEQQQGQVSSRYGSDDTGPGSLDPILTTKKQAWVKSWLNDHQIKPKSPGYGAKFKEAGDAYEQELNKALAKAPFDVFANHPVNAGVPKGDMLKQAHEALRDEFGISDNISNSVNSNIGKTNGLQEKGQETTKTVSNKSPARNKVGINDSDDLLTAIAKLGGLNAAEAKAQGIDPASFKLRGHGIKRVFNHGKNSKSYDSMAEALREQGFDVPMANDLVELVSGAVNQGNKVYTAKGAELQAEIMAQEHVSEQEAQHVLRIESLYEAAKQHDADFGTNYLDIILKLDDLSTDNLSEWEQDLEADRKARQQKTDGDSQTPVSGETELESYTEQEIADREREQKRRDKQAQADELKARQKEKADKEIDTLADEMLGNFGSNDIFGMASPMDNQAKNTSPSWQKSGFNDIRIEFNIDDLIIEIEDTFPLKKIAASWYGISHSGSGHAKEERSDLIKTVKRLYDEAAELAETDKQKSALNNAIVKFKNDYIGQTLRLANARSGTYSSMIAGRSNFNSKQANRRGSAYDRANESFDAWYKKATSEIKQAVEDAKSPDQLAKEQQAKIDKKLAIQEKNDAFLRKLLNFKPGDDLKAGKYPIIRVSKDKDGLPNSLTISGEGILKGIDDKIKVVGVLYKSKSDLQAAIDRVNESSNQDQQAEPEADAEPVTTDAETQSESVDPASPIDAFKLIMQGLNEGAISIDEYKKGFEALVANKETIEDELSKQTKAKLLESGYISYYHKNEKKEFLVHQAYKGMLADFFISDDLLSYGMGKDSYVNAIRNNVESLTQDDLDSYAAKRKKAIEDRKQEIAEKIEGVKDPKTLDDFQNYMRVKIQDESLSFADARMTLTPEQRAKYDELVATKSRQDRNYRKERDADYVATNRANTDAEIVKTVHTRDNYDLWVVKAADRVEREIYNDWNATAKKLGGWYSSFKGRGATPGFQFKTEESAQAFQQYISKGDKEAVQEQAKARRDAYQDDKTQGTVERLTEMADRLEESANDSLNQDRKVNTNRRAGMAARAEDAARKQIALASTMRNIADAISDGTANFLDRVRQKVQVEFLQGMVGSAHYRQLMDETKGSYGEYEKRKYEAPTQVTADYAEFPSYSAYRSDLANLARQLVETDGTKQLGKDLLKVADDVTDAYLKFAKENLIQVGGFRTKDGDIAAFTSMKQAELSIAASGYNGKAIPFKVSAREIIPILSPSEAQIRGVWKGDNDKRITLNRSFGDKLIAALGKANRKQQKISVPWQFERAHSDLSRLQKMGIESPAEFRAALREFIDLKEQPAQEDKIKKLERSMVGRANDGLDFFPTPQSVADEMIAAAEIQEGMKVLEPSAGMGHIADQIRDAGVDPDVIELSGNRRELLEAKGHNIVAHDFMDYSEGGYDRIIMNPPFSDRRDAAHVQHAYDLLKPGGRLVAIMGEGVFFGSDKKASSFMDWLDSVGGEHEKMPENTFMDKSLPVTTGVNTRMVVIDKPLLGETPNNDDLKYSRSTSEPTANKHTKASLTQSMQKVMDSKFGNGWFNRLLSTGKFEIISKEEAMIKHNTSAYRALGFYRASNGTTYFIADNISKTTDLYGLALHEIGVHAMHMGRNDAEFQNILKDLDKLKDRNPKIKAAYARIPDNTKVEHRLEELAAYLVQYSPSLSISKRIVAWFKNALRNIAKYLKGADRLKMMQWANRIDDADVVLMATKALKTAPDTLVLSNADLMNNGILRSNDTPDTIEVDGVQRPIVNSNGQQIHPTEEGIRNFWKWFGDSKVVDRQGRPLVVYHGTPFDFDAFDTERVARHYGKGAFFAASASDASLFSGSTSSMDERGANPRIIPAYIKLDKPIRVKKESDFSEAKYIGGWIDRIRRLPPKHDGIITTAAWMPDGINWVIARNPSQIKSAIGNSGLFDAENNDIRYSFASTQEANADNDPNIELNRRIREQHKTVSHRAKQWLKREFSPGGLLPKQVFDLKISRDSEMNAEELISHNLVANLDRSVKSEFGAKYEDLTQSQKDTIDARLKGEAVSLPQAVLDSIDAMRLHIDKLSGRYARSLFDDARQLEAEGNDAAAAAKAELLNKIAGNIGKYVNRSYRAFDDKNWAKKVPDDVLNNARRYFTNQFIEKGSSNPTGDAQRVMNDILKTGTAFDTFEQYIKESKLGAKDLSVLIKRKEISPEVRALLGEYKDARINFVKSATKMSRLIFNDDFLKQVKSVGLVTADNQHGFLFSENDRPSDEHTVKIASDASSPMAPLNGLYTYPEINQAFNDALNRESMEDWYRMIVQANGLIKYGKTVLSPTTAVRNWMSAFFFTMANAHFDMSHMQEATQSFKTYFDKDNGRIDYLNKLIRLGVLYDTPYAGEMMALLADSKFESALMGEGSSKLDKVKVSIKEWLDIATKFYRFGDDFWKIIGFENEKQILMQYRNMSEMEAEKEAAKRIRDTYPTYSMTGRAINKLRRFPLVGTFVSFPAEILRTSYNMLKYAQEDMAYSKDLGRRRVAGLAMVSSFAFAAQMLAMSLTGMDDDEEEALRDLAPPWSKNSNIIPLGRDKDGSLIYLDLSFLDPYNYFKRPLNAILRGQPIDETVYEVTRELLTPFFGQDIAFGAIVDVWQNKKESGGRVFNPHDSAPNITFDIANHLRKSLQPSVFNNIERMADATMGYKSQSGRVNTMTEEVAALAGFRASRLNPKVALYYKSYEFQDKLKDASSILNDVARNPNKVSKSELKDAHERARKTRGEAFQDMHELVNSARKSGLSVGQIRRLLKLNHVSAKNINYILLGREPKWVPGKTFLKSSIDKSSELFGPEITSEFTDRRRMVLSE
jgi:hypothetical protein